MGRGGEIREIRLILQNVMFLLVFCFVSVHGPPKVASVVNSSVSSSFLELCHGDFLSCFVD